MGMIWVYLYASVRVPVRGLTRFHVAMVQFVLSAGNGNGGAGHYENLQRVKYTCNIRLALVVHYMCTTSPLHAFTTHM